MKFYEDKPSLRVMSINQVPDFILEEIFELLDRTKLLGLSQACKIWRRIIVPLFWRNFEDVVLYRRPLLLKERGRLVRHLHVALNFTYRGLCGWELTLSHCPYLVSGTFEVRTIHELKQLFGVATSLLPHLTKLTLFIKFDMLVWPKDSKFLLGSIEELNIDFAHHLEVISGDFFTPLQSIRLRRLTLSFHNSTELSLLQVISDIFPRLTHFDISASFVETMISADKAPQFQYLRSLKFKSTHILTDLDPIIIFGTSCQLPRLLCLEMDSGPRSLKSFQHFALGSFWPLVTHLACDIGQHISRTQLTNLANITHLNLRFESKKDSIGSIPMVLSALQHLTHVSFSGYISDAAFDFSPIRLPPNSIREIKLEGIQHLHRLFVAWLISLVYLQKLTLVGCFDELAFAPTRFPPRIRFPYLLYARFPRDAIHFSAWIRRSAPDLNDCTQLPTYE
ncbi:hypothetical protein DSO57_1003511 [Entomophthora muscae]|uniref:Uncharacterized protein n=1 Tax=Entomophthora muscae TaxID=34485 RepID=A0ACC2SAK0_9FUNG|nr:hypothetical protein DSO57_1003511 [Entomophthora muscae]